jgi:hypothetical protein
VAFDSTTGATATNVTLGEDGAVAANGISSIGAARGASTLTDPAAATRASSASRQAITGPDVLGLILDGLAALALGFIVLTFSRHWRPTSSVP